MAPKRILVGPLPVPSEDIGDASISLGAVRLLRRGIPQAHITGWHSHPSAGSDAATDGTFVRAYELDEVVPSPWYAPGLCRTGTVASVGIRGLVTPWAAHVCRKRIAGLPLGGMAGIVRSLCRADLVVLRGGGHFESSSLWQDLWLRNWAFYEISMARILGVPYAIWGYSVPRLTGPTSRALFVSLIRNSAITVCRERLTHDLLVSLGAPLSKLAVLPDTAFALGPASMARTQQLLSLEGLENVEPPLIGFSLHWRAERIPRLLEAIVHAAQHMHSRYGVHIVMVPHRFTSDLCPLPSVHDDRETCRRIAHVLGDPTWVHVLEGQYTPEEFVALYARMEMTVTSRLHPAILSAVTGRPSILLSYEKHKFQGTASIMGLPESVLEEGTVTPEHLQAKIVSLWNERALAGRHLASKMVEIRRQLERYVDVTLTGMGLDAEDTRRC